MNKSALKVIFEEKAQNYMCQYIYEKFENHDDISIKDIAVNCYLSESTITRWFAKHGFSGFKEFKYILLNERFENVDSLPKNLNIDYEFFLCPIKNMIKKNNGVVLDQIIFAIINCTQKIMITTVGENSAAAYELKTRLIHFGFNAIYDFDNHLNYINCKNLGEKDILIAISYSGETQEVARNVQIAKSKKVTIITITSNPSSPIASLSDYVLQISNEDNFLRVFNIKSRISLYYIVLKLSFLIYTSNPIKFKSIQERNAY